MKTFLTIAMMSALIAGPVAAQTAPALPVLSQPTRVVTAPEAPASATPAPAPV